MQSKSKHEAMQQIVPSSRTVTPASKANAKKKSHKKVKSKDKRAAKYKKKDEIKKAAVALAKKKEDEAEKANAQMLRHCPHQWRNLQRQMRPRQMSQSNQCHLECFAW